MVYKRLKNYIDVLKDEIIEINCDEKTANFVIKNISYNSKDACPGTIFICKGKEFKKEYLIEAMTNGAVCYIAEEYITDELPYIIVKDVRNAMNIISGHMYDHVWNNRLVEIGVTGTKGKSTTTYFIKSILDCVNKDKTAMISGINNYDGKNIEKANLTTPETLELHKLLFNSVKNGCDTLVMEVSSQGLKYKRVEDVKYKIGVFLNIGMDHISSAEHESFEDYFHSKLEIFKQCEIACINMDIEVEYLYKILDAAVTNGCKIVTFGTKQHAYYRGEVTHESLEETKFELFYGSFVTDMKINMGGSHNMINALAAIAVCRELGISMKYIEKGLSKVTIPGRMEVFQIPEKDAKVVVDYAHNKMSYEALFNLIDKTYPNYKKMFMFGCASDRAHNRRKEAGEIAQKEADKVVITKYNSGKESFDQICKDIQRYISPKKDVTIIEDRHEAIEYCLQTAKDKWIIVMTGCEKDSEEVKVLLNNI